MVTTKAKPSEKINYFSHIIGRVDRDAGVIRGVSVITMGEAEGHGLIVDEQTLEGIKHSAETQRGGKLKAKLNHRSGVEAVFGFLKNFRIVGPKLLGDLHLLKQHKDYEQTLEQIETLHDQIGLSVAFAGEGKLEGDGKKHARCNKILSVDLVPEPAANPTGMFSKPTSQVDTLNTDMDAETQVQNEEQEQSLTTDQKLDMILQNQQHLSDRIQSVEDFNQALAEELSDDEEGEEGEEGELEGDDGTEAADLGNEGIDSQGGTDAGARTQGEQAMAPAMAAEMAALRKQIIELQRRNAQLDALAQAEADQEQQIMFEQASGVLEDKILTLAEHCQEQEMMIVELQKAVRNGGKITSPSVMSFGANGGGDFEQMVEAHVKAGKKRGEAIMLTVREHPEAHHEFLAKRGVISLEQ